MLEMAGIRQHSSDEEDEDADADEEDSTPSADTERRRRRRDELNVQRKLDLRLVMKLQSRNNSPRRLRNHSQEDKSGANELVESSKLLEMLQNSDLYKVEGITSPASASASASASKISSTTDTTNRIQKPPISPKNSPPRSRPTAAGRPSLGDTTQVPKRQSRRDLMGRRSPRNSLTSGGPPRRSLNAITATSFTATAAAALANTLPPGWENDTDAAKDEDDRNTKKRPPRPGNNDRSSSRSPTRDSSTRRKNSRSPDTSPTRDRRSSRPQRASGTIVPMSSSFGDLQIATEPQSRTTAATRATTGGRSPKRDSRSGTRSSSSRSPTRSSRPQRASGTIVPMSITYSSSLENLQTATEQQQQQQQLATAAPRTSTTATTRATTGGRSPKRDSRSGTSSSSSRSPTRGSRPQRASGTIVPMTK
jgi:hypothetical protein